MRKPHKVTIHKVRQTWWLNYYLDGQRIRESLGTHSQKIAERKRDEKEKDILLGRAIGPQREVPVKSFLDEYLLHAKGHKRPSTGLRSTFLPWEE